MGKRLTSITTRTGDDGTTGLGDHTRVSKHSLRIQAIGDVDELNAHIGLWLCEALPDDVRNLLTDVQHRLFDLGGELSVPGLELLKPQAIATLNQAIAHHNQRLPPLEEFVLPQGPKTVALAHVCRTIARRAERTVVALGLQETLKDTPRCYLNRLSDLLFVLSRAINHSVGGSEVCWHTPTPPPDYGATS